METVRILVNITKPLKAKLDALRAEGTTASGLIRRLLNEFFAGRSHKPERRASK